MQIRHNASVGQHTAHVGQAGLLQGCLRVAEGFGGEFAEKPAVLAGESAEIAEARIERGFTDARAASFGTEMSSHLVQCAVTEIRRRRHSECVYERSPQSTL